MSSNNTLVKKSWHIVTSFDFGGVERHLQVVGRNASYSRWKHFFCAIGQGGAVADTLQSMGSPVVCLNKSTRIPSIGTIWTLYRLFRRNRPTVVHTHGAEANFHGLVAAWLAGVPVRIGEEIGIPSHSQLARHVFRLIYRFAHRVIGISGAVTVWLVESDEVPASKAVRIYNPVEFSSCDLRAPDPEQVFRIGFVGRLEPVKNPLALVGAVANLRDEGIPVELWIVGDGSQRQEIEEQIDQYGVRQLVRLWGYRNNPFDYVCQCNLYVQPSLSEGFGIALVEAMGCEIPVLATSVGGAPEIITHGETGWLVDCSDAGALSRVLKDVWEQRADFPAIGEAGRDAVQGRFEPSVYMGQLDSLYEFIGGNDCP